MKVIECDGQGPPVFVDDDPMWIDVVTTAVPLLLSERCMISFLEHCKHPGCQLRWIFHLDQYPDEKLDCHWEENMKQAVRMSWNFDDSIIMGSRCNQGFAASYRRVLGEVRHDVLLVEDDYEWTEGWNLLDLIDHIKMNGADGHNFERCHTQYGATSPTFWSYKSVQYLLEHWSNVTDKGNEKDFKRILRHRFHNVTTRGAIPQQPYRHLGNKRLKELGFANCWRGRTLDIEPTLLDK